ncbi:MAG: 1-deoxy-D-xylulose-5-phosphate reductoisomerase [Oscillospiraceae bacterium]|nr:1-deoxy-D-xylulose-5-phosphate reductoisomerase [Ruminococcus sp.]MDO4881795.1 1-deoxy-D-xylulose-5-phosphate reductoisomerase [Oscillospiraceae bacterium]
MINSISILGSTGSIGTQSLDVVDKLGLKVSAITAASNVDLIENQIRKYKPELAVLFNEDKAAELRLRVKDTGTRVLGGMDGLIEAAVIPSASLVLNSVVGMVGLKPTMAAIEAKKDIALANKETLVAGGDLVTDAVKRNGVKLLPVDSEHSAIFQCLQGAPDNKALKKLILTASGGPFFGKTYDELKDVTVEQALNHPNWSMGAKITIDSASMMNKGLEIIEAARLFDVSGDDIDVVVHRESIIHSLVEYTDNSVIAQLGVPDMRIPIQYAITYPSRFESPVAELSLAEIGKMTFFEPDYETFKCLNACKTALKMGGAATAIANGANEEANMLFRNGKIKFLDIGELVCGAVESVKNFVPSSVDDVIRADSLARQYVKEKVGVY